MNLKIINYQSGVLIRRDIQCHFLSSIVGTACAYDPGLELISFYCCPVPKLNHVTCGSWVRYLCWLGFVVVAFPIIEVANLIDGNVNGGFVRILWLFCLHVIRQL